MNKKQLHDNKFYYFVILINLISRNNTVSVTQQNPPTEDQLDRLASRQSGPGVEARVVLAPRLMTSQKKTTRRSFCKQKEERRFSSTLNMKISVGFQAESTMDSG